MLLWTLYLMVSPLKFALGLVLFLITIAVGELLLSGKEESLEIAGQSNHIAFSHQMAVNLVIVVVFALSLATVFYVPAIKGEIFVEWSALELPTIARLIAAFGLNFFPGYIILAIAGRNDLGKLSTLITSYFLSLFVLVLTGFVSALATGIINEFFLNAFLTVCAALIIIYVFKCFIYRKSGSESQKTPVSSSTGSRKLPALLVGLAVAFVAVWLWWMYSNIGFFIGTRGTDMWRVHFAALTFTDYQAFRWLHVPWLFYLYLACSMVLSGAPSVNAYVSLYPLMGVQFLSFYLMTSSFFKDRRIASLATLGYTIFSGPGWLYALYLRNFSPIIDYDSWTRIISKTGDIFLLQGWYPPFAVGFTAPVVAYAALWWLMYATWRLDLRRGFNFFLMSIILAMSYLVHGVEALIYLTFLAALLIVYFLTQNTDGKKQVRWAAFSAFAALGIVALLDVALTPQYDYFNSVSSFALPSRYYFFNSPSFYALTFASLLIGVLTYGKYIENKLTRLYHMIHQKLSPRHLAFVKRRLIEVIFFLYGVSLIVFIVLFRSLSIATTGLGWVPWYVYLVIGGVPTFLGLVGIALVLRKWNNSEKMIRDIVVFCGVSIVMLFIMGQLTSFVNQEFFYTGYWERRTLSYIHPVISILMAYTLVALFRRVTLQKSSSVRYLPKVGMVSLLISLILLSSVSSTLLAGDFASRIFFADVPTKEELDALRYLHYSLPAGSKTGYINRMTGMDYIRAFASDKWTEDPDQWLGRYSSPGYVLSAIRNADIKFLYFNHIRDSQDLKKNLFLQQLIEVLPMVFNNSEVTIYSIPPLHWPSSSSPLGVVSSEKTGALNDAYVLWFFSLMMGEDRYMTITNTSDPNVLNVVKSIIVPFDPLPIEEEEGQLLEWVSNGGHLVVSNTNHYGVFRDLLGLTHKVPLVSCDSTDNWKALHKRGEILLETDLKIEGNASLRLQNNLSAWEGWIYTPPAHWDLSQYDYLGIWIYGTGGGPMWALYLTDLNNNEKYFRYDISVFDFGERGYVPSFEGWKLHVVPIKQYFGDLDLSAIKQLKINTGAQLPVNILIDDIFALSESGENQLPVTADGIQGEVNIDLPNIEVETLSLGDNATIIANYTEKGVTVAPFAIQKNVGSGKVTYLNINLLYQSILSEGSGFTSPYELLLTILKMIGIEGLP